MDGGVLLLAHTGGVVEALSVGVPLVALALLLVAGRRKARREEQAAADAAAPGAEPDPPAEAP